MSGIGEKMICKSCGKLLNDDARFCSYCGAANLYVGGITPPSFNNSRDINSESNRQIKHGKLDLYWDTSDYPSARPKKKAEDVVFEWGDFGNNSSNTKGLPDENRFKAPEKKVQTTGIPEGEFETTFTPAFKEKQFSAVSKDWTESIRAFIEEEQNRDDKEEFEINLDLDEEKRAIEKEILDETIKISREDFNQFIAEQEEAAERKEEPNIEDILEKELAEDVAEETVEAEAVKEELELTAIQESAEPQAEPLEVKVEEEPVHEETVQKEDAINEQDRFKTFHEKNEKFQALLDIEYAKLQSDKSIDELKEQVRDENKQAELLAKANFAPVEADNKNEDLSNTTSVPELEKQKEATRKAWEDFNAEQKKIYGKKDKKVLKEAKKAEKEKRKEEKAIEEVNDKGGDVAFKIAVVILMVIAFALGACVGFKIFDPNGAISKGIDSVIYDITSIFGSESSEPVNISSYINSEIAIEANEAGIVVQYDKNLAYDSSRNYGYDDILTSTVFTDNSFYTDENGEQITDGQALMAAVIGEYGKKYDDITALNIGDIRSGENEFYVILSYEREKETKNQIVKLKKGADKMEISDIIDFK